MELNHQIRLCRPFPFLFGFRANRNVNLKRKRRFFTFYFIKLPHQWRTAAEEGGYVSASALYCNHK
jgi:hypothetical protein